MRLIDYVADNLNFVKPSIKNNNKIEIIIMAGG